MLDKNNVYAVIGASSQKQKYGYKILKDLKENNFQVIPVNLKEKEILGLKVYKSILDIKRKIDIAIFVVPPIVTEKILPDIKKLKVNKVWMQPGSESQKAIDYCEKNKINCVYNACIIIKNKRQLDDN